MPHHRQITFVGTTARCEPHARIAYVGGGSETTGTRWQLSHEEAIEVVESRRCRFWVRVDGRSRWIVVARVPRGPKYLKAQDDDLVPGALLALAPPT